MRITNRKYSRRIKRIDNDNKMTRNNAYQPSYSSSRSTLSSTSFNDDSFYNLPDLSNLREKEIQHILNVLGRDESLRSKHLARFMQLRKEVNELEQRPQPTSSSVCARCQATFGFLFNTGSECPKCGAKVCKQCRLIYNVNDSGWLCQLCCKQMQLMSYSGEWVYTVRSNLRKDTLTASEIIRKSLTPSVSIPNLNYVSSSDTETEGAENTPFNRRRSSDESSRDARANPSGTTNRMIIQNTSDVQKLNTLKRNAQKRPLSASPSQPATVPAFEFSSASNTRGGLSDDEDSLNDQSTVYTDKTSNSSVFLPSNKSRVENSSTPKSALSESTLKNHNDKYFTSNNKRQNVDCASVTSSEWGGESERGESFAKRQETPPKRGSEQSLSTRMRLNDSIQSIRDAVKGIKKPSLSASRTSITSDKRSKTNLSDKGSSVTPNVQTLLDSNARPLPSPTSSIPTTATVKTAGSSNFLASNEKIPRIPSTAESSESKINKKLVDHDDSKPIIPRGFSSTEKLGTIDSDNDDIINHGDEQQNYDDNDDDDIDESFEKGRLGLAMRQSSDVDVRGSQTSINSASSGKKPRFGLEISGKIELNLIHNSSTGALDIRIIKCTGLAGAKRNHLSDPYVKMYLLPDRSRNSKRKTSVQKNTVDPVFNERVRYHLTKQEFETRVLWVTVWHQASIGQNDFLGEVHISLASCELDSPQEYTLSAQKQKQDLTPTIPTTVGPSEIQFEITYIENQNNRDIGTIQIHHVAAKHIFFGKNNVDAVCKGLLMPDNVKRRIPVMKKGPAPYWDIPMRWEGVHRSSLGSASIEISIWCQERFRTFKLAFVRLNLSRGHFDGKPVRWSDATRAEKSAWELFLRQPTDKNAIKLPLRPATPK